MSDEIIVVGSSGHAKVVIDVVEKEGKYKIVGLIDRFRQLGEQTLGYPILGAEEDLPCLFAERKLVGGIVAIGDNYTRWKVVINISKLVPDFLFVNAIHPRANIARDVTIGSGTVVMAGATANTSSRVGRCCILNTNSSLDHDSVMEDFASLAPNASTGGYVRIGRCSAISIGAAILHKIEIGEHTVIGAGSVLLHNVGAYKVAYGLPARVIRDRSAGDKYL